MDYLHVKNLEKYNPGYKDRSLVWAKIYFSMVNGDPDCELIDNEIDWGRLVRFILLELQAKKPIPIDQKYLQRKGIDCKKRPIALTVQMLHNFVELVTEDPKVCTLEKSRVEKSRVEKNSESVTEFFDYYKQKTGKQFKLTPDKTKLINDRLKNYSVDDLKRAVDNFVADDWDGRSGHLDLIYCIGIRNKVDNLEKWLHRCGQIKTDADHFMEEFGGGR